MKLMSIILAVGLLTLCAGCKSEPSNPVVKQIIPHLVQLSKTPTQQQMSDVIDVCEDWRQAHGRKTVANALKQIARQHPEVQDEALSVLPRYVSVEAYGIFVKELKTQQ
ncbi:MAG: hypothetical protein ACOC0A_01870 [Planctomycetota bacterium]